MSIASDLAALFHRDLTRLLQQVHACAEQNILWECPPGIANSCGNLILHLEGNLREYVGRQFGNVPYRRMRDEEFARKDVPVAAMAAGIEDLIQMVPRVIGKLSEEELQAILPENPLNAPISAHQFLIHLNGHLNYHLGQIDYLRRLLTRGTAISYAAL
jgi:Protein of unknown function (DUF664)